MEVADDLPESPAAAQSEWPASGATTGRVDTNGCGAAAEPATGSATRPAALGEQRCRRRRLLRRLDDHGVAARDGGGDSTAQADLVDDTRRPGRNPVARQVHGEIADVGGTPGWSISAAPTVLPGPVAAVVGSPVEEFGRLYMAFNNAGIMISLSNAADEPVEAFAESLPSICAGSGPRYHYAQNWTVSNAEARFERRGATHR
jgi:hypothetical protein